MDFGCPVCNGLRDTHVHCPACGHLLEDRGRLEQAFGDYSPYREIDDLRRTNAYVDLQRNQCMHLFYCPTCKQQKAIGIREEVLTNSKNTSD